VRNELPPRPERTTWLSSSISAESKHAKGMRRQVPRKSAPARVRWRRQTPQMARMNGPEITRSSPKLTVLITRCVPEHQADSIPGNYETLR